MAFLNIINEVGSTLLYPLAQALDGLGDLTQLSGEELEALGRLLHEAEAKIDAARARMTGEAAPAEESTPAEGQ